MQSLPAESELQQHDAVPRLPHCFELDRRNFFKLMGGGLLVCVAAGHADAQESGSPRSNDDDLPATLDSWLHIDEDGKVTAFTGKVEIGQNIRTSLSQQVAEELRVPLSSVRLVMGDTDLTPYDMGTFGSRTTPTMGLQLRKVASSARAILAQMAAEKWHMTDAALVLDQGKVRDPKSGRTISYAELTHGQKLAKTIADAPALVPPKG